jgi:integrase
MSDAQLAIPRLFNDPDWQNCLEDFLLRTYDRSESAGSFRIYRLHLRRLFTDPSRPGDDYTPHEVSAFIHAENEHTGKPISSSTLNQKHAVVACFYKFASTYPVKRGEGKPKPLFTDIPPTASIQRRKPARNYKALTEDEIERFFKAIEDIMSEQVAKHATQFGIAFDASKFAEMDDGHKCGYIKQLSAHSETARAALMHPFIVYLRDRSLFWLYLTSARRRKEARLIQYQDIEPATFVEQGVARKGYLFRFHGKGHGAQLDACEMAESSHRLIMRYLTFSGRLETIAPEDYIFCGIAPLSGRGKPVSVKKPMADSSLQNAFEKYAARAKLNKNRTIHSFRHSSARLRADRGVDIRKIQRLLRHKNLSTTSDYLDALVSPPDPEAMIIEDQFEWVAK